MSKVVQPPPFPAQTGSLPGAGPKPVPGGGPLPPGKLPGPAGNPTPPTGLTPSFRHPLGGSLLTGPARGAPPRFREGTPSGLRTISTGVPSAR